MIQREHLFQTADDQSADLDDFMRIQHRYPWLQCFHPNRSKSPWHVQARILCADGDYIILNFWPHKGKAQRYMQPAVEGYADACAMIEQALDDSQDDLELIE